MKNLLNLKGVEAVDGSPIVDIKPYVKPYYGADHPTLRHEWTKSTKTWTSTSLGLKQRKITGDIVCGVASFIIDNPPFHRL